MFEVDELEVLHRRAKFLGRRSLLELELVINEVINHDLPRKVSAGDKEWLRELIKILELDDYILLDAVLGRINLSPEFDTEVLEVLRSSIPGRRE